MMAVMKKLFYIMSICALALISCQKEEFAEKNTAEGGFTYTFVGTHAPQVKASVGDKNESNKWPILWEAGDKLGVYDSEGALLGTAELAAESAGQNQGTFTVTANRELAEGETLTLKYPYSEGEAFVPTKQTQLAVSSSAGLGANAVASATTIFTAEGTTFSLSHANAYVRFELTSDDEYYYNTAFYNGVTLWCEGENLSGAAGAEKDYVKVTLKDPEPIGVSETKYIWMTTNEVDLTDKKFYAIVHMTRGTKNASIQLPVSLNGKGKLSAHAVTTIKLPNIKEVEVPAWYETTEARYIPQDGECWSYGPENTVHFESNKTTKHVSLKARGNFMKVKEPKYVQVYYFANTHEPNEATGETKNMEIDGKVVANRTDTTFGEDIEITKTDYSIEVLLNNATWGKGQMAALLVKDAEKNVIWGVNLWLSMQKMITETYANGEQVLNRNLGTDELFSSVSSTNTRVGGSFFQWGRPWAFPYYDSSYGKNI